MEQGFRGNCGSQGKLGMCPSLAEPDSDGFPRRSVFNHKPQANKKFFDPTIFQKCWRGSGRAALIAARRQRNPCAMLLAHGGGGEKSESFSRRRTRPPRLVKLERETSILQLFRGNSCNEMFHGKHFEIASRETI